jgi:hypothetical protein
VELLNSKTGKDSYDINTGKQRYTLFPGNVATLDASSIKEMVTVFGVLRAEDGSLPHARIDNHIGTTVTNEEGEFSLDVDKANPMLTFRRGSDCEAELDLEQHSARGLGRHRDLPGAAHLCHGERVLNMNITHRLLLALHLAPAGHSKAVRLYPKPSGRNARCAIFC